MIINYGQDRYDPCTIPEFGWIKGENHDSLDRILSSYSRFTTHSIVTEIILEYKTAVSQCPFITALPTEYASQSHEYFINTVKFRNVTFIGNY
jgi:hypothetical protein